MLPVLLLHPNIHRTDAASFTAVSRSSQHWCCQFYCCIQIFTALMLPVLLLYLNLHSTDVASFTAVSKFPQHWYCCTGCTGAVWVIQYMHLTGYKERLHETYNTWQRKKKKKTKTTTPRMSQLTSLSDSTNTWSYSLKATRNMMDVTFSKQWIHFLRSDLWPPTSTILKQRRKDLKLKCQI